MGCGDSIGRGSCQSTGRREVNLQGIGSGDSIGRGGGDFIGRGSRQSTGRCVMNVQGVGLQTLQGVEG